MLAQGFLAQYVFAREDRFPDYLVVGTHGGCHNHGIEARIL